MYKVKSKIIYYVSKLLHYQHDFILTHALIICFLFVMFETVFARNDNSYITTDKNKGAFTLSSLGTIAPLLVSSNDYPGVIRVLKLFKNDLTVVTNIKPDVLIDTIPDASEIVIVGTIGKSELIDKLISEKKLDVTDIEGKWETFVTQIIKNPFPNADKALVIAGSDKRGTIYGMFDLSEQIGVSPWYWWADVPVKKKNEIYVLPGRHTKGEPKVKYRGIFINDEAPALSGWSIKKYGTEKFNHNLYEHVFELILRLKGNLLWPAMWGRAFYDDDPINPKLADEYGIVISTSHHEPMMRAHSEWERYGSGSWNYKTNKEKLREFWKDGIERMNDYESIVTLAMRGDGDEPMSEEANITLLQGIVKDQREIITQVSGKNIEEVPQVWALYKEVQEYYDRGMRVPEDVTLLLCDDNWGNIRKLPKLGDSSRTGGYGIYYHYDYVGGPRNYKWLNTTQIERVWEQMHLAYEYGANEIWIVNVGDIKPMEFPIEFFLDYAWNPDNITAADLPEYYENWTEEQFGIEYSEPIADIIRKYTKYNARRKPELLSTETYSLVNYREAEIIVEDYNSLYAKAKVIYDLLSEEYKDAFYQLVLHPVEACANLNELYVTTAINRLYAEQGRNITNELALKVKQLFEKDAQITTYYNEIMSNGKWNHMMDQTHIGYTYWQQPESNSMPQVENINVPSGGEMGVAVEGSTHWYPKTDELSLPEIDLYNNQKYYIEIFNRGMTSFEYFILTGKPWIIVSSQNGVIETEKRFRVSLDWNKVPKGDHKIPITIIGPENTKVIVYAIIKNPLVSAEDVTNCFVESNGYVSIKAENYTRVVTTDSVDWEIIPNLGHASSAMISIPVTSRIQKVNSESPRLEYDVYLFDRGELKVKVYLSPTLNFHNNQGLRYGVSFDDETPQIMNMHLDKEFRDWEKSVSNNVTVEVSNHIINKPGKHVLKFWTIDPGVVLQKLVIETGEVKPSYLGPPQSFNSSLIKHN